MKKGFKDLFCVLLISALLAPGFPLYTPQDVSRDLRIDLKDAILHLQQMTGASADPETFKTNLRNAFETFFVLAGLKTVIKQDQSKTSGTGSWAPGSPFLISSNRPFTPEDTGTAIPDHIFRCQSISIAPASPPPKTV